MNSFAKLLDFTRECVREFIPQLLERDLAHELGAEEPCGLRGEFVIRIQIWAFRQPFRDRLHEGLDPFPGDGGTEDGLGMQHPQHVAAFGIEEIGLVEGQQHMGAGRLVELCGLGEGRRNGPCRVDDMHQHVRVADGGQSGIAHGAVQRVAGLEQSGCIENHHLGVVGGADADDTMAGALRLAGRDGEAFADQSIEERGLPGIGEPCDGDDTGSGGSSHGSTRRHSVVTRGVGLSGR